MLRVFCETWERWGVVLIVRIRPRLLGAHPVGLLGRPTGTEGLPARGAPSAPATRPLSSPGWSRSGRVGTDHPPRAVAPNRHTCQQFRLVLGGSSRSAAQS